MAEHAMSIPFQRQLLRTALFPSSSAVKPSTSKQGILVNQRVFRKEEKDFAVSIISRPVLTKYSVRLKYF
jgi:hypothetical protein